MDGKKLVMTALLLLLLMAPTFAATVTAAWNAPANGSIYSNNPSNRRTIDINARWTDDNASNGSDMNITIRVMRQVDWTTLQTLKSDANVFDATLNPTSAWSCAAVGIAATTGSCRYNWTMPLNTEMPNGVYCLDVNVISYYDQGGGSVNEGDANALTCITINNGFGNAAATRAMLLPTAIILVALLLVSAVTAITVFGADIGKTLMAVGFAAIVIAIVLMIFGQVVAMI